MTTIYKICPAPIWHAAEARGIFHGSGIDLTDGFIHFSTRAQVFETAARHFAGQSDLVLVAIDGDRLGEALTWEPARSGDLFPHLYEPLDLAAMLWAKPLPLDQSGRHSFPDLDQ